MSVRTHPKMGRAYVVVGVGRDDGHQTKTPSRVWHSRRRDAEAERRACGLSMPGYRWSIVVLEEAENKTARPRPTLDEKRLAYDVEMSVSRWLRAQAASRRRAAGRIRGLTWEAIRVDADVLERASERLEDGTWKLDGKARVR